MQIRTLQPSDLQPWRELWAAYNAFYGRSGATAVTEAVTRLTWQRFFDPTAAMFALVAEQEQLLLGLAHYLFHPSTNRAEPLCYLQDLFTAPQARGQGIGRALLEAVADQAALAGAGALYWHTQASNQAARALYEQVGRHRGFIVYSRELSPAAGSPTPVPAERV